MADAEDDGKNYSTNHYSLEMIIAVGFKVNFERAVQFRKWVNRFSKDYEIKGWIMNVKRIKKGTYLTEKYFEEQLERVREIRASERKFYQKVTDLYAPQLLIMIRLPPRQNAFMQRCKIKCIMPFMDILLLK